MRGDPALAKPLGQLIGDPLGHPAGIDENQRRPVFSYLPGDQIQDLGQLVRRRHRAELVTGELKRDVQLAAVPGVHDRAPR